MGMDDITPVPHKVFLHSMSGSEVNFDLGWGHRRSFKYQLNILSGIPCSPFMTLRLSRSVLFSNTLLVCGVGNYRLWGIRKSICDWPYGPLDAGGIRCWCQIRLYPTSGACHWCFWDVLYLPVKVRGIMICGVVWTIPWPSTPPISPPPWCGMWFT